MVLAEDLPLETIRVSKVVLAGPVAETTTSAVRPVVSRPIQCGESSASAAR